MNIRTTLFVTLLFVVTLPGCLICCDGSELFRGGGNILGPGSIGAAPEDDSAMSDETVFDGAPEPQ